MYTDKPRPGKGYVLFLLLILLSVFCVYPVAFVISYLGGPPNSIHLFQGFVAAIPCVAIGILMLVGLHAAYHTEYTVRDNRLELKGGGALQRKVALREIIEAKKTPYNARMLSWAMTGRGVRNMGICNRFKNGVVLTTKMGNIYLSPSDPDKFLELLSSLQDELKGTK